MTKHRESRYEKIVYSVLEKSGVKFARQAQIAGYSRIAGGRHRYDAVFRVNRVALEIDGCWYHGCRACFPKRTGWQLAAYRRDRKIDSVTRKLGWKMVRIKIHDLRMDPERVVERLLRRHALLFGELPAFQTRRSNTHAGPPIH